MLAVSVLPGHRVIVTLTDMSRGKIVRPYQGKDSGHLGRSGVSALDALGPEVSMNFALRKPS